MHELEKEFLKDVKDVDRDQLLEWRTMISSYNTKMEKIAESYKEILKIPINNADILMDIKRIGENYVKLETLKQKFQDKLHKEISVRELDKDVKFNKHQLNIQLEKFTGYDATSDVYTFRSNFEKIHLDSTPKRLLPDLLKNNYLDEPAKNLVTSLDNIDEIWDRLQSAYGDTNIMIRKKLQSLLKIDLTRTRDNERTLTGLSKLTNAIHDIIKLAKTHNIEERLYFGDGLTKVYQLIGDKRVTRFLSSIYEDNLNEKQTWQRLLLFLEKETKLVQQKIMINDTARKENHDNSKTNKGMRSFYSPTQSSESVVCFICGVSAGVDDHVATLGPGGSTIVQYFTCRTFAEWTPAKRLSTLKEKGYCFQCLLPGADSSQGKHQEGRCQHEYVCTHSSHQRYTSRKSVFCM